MGTDDADVVVYQRSKQRWIRQHQKASALSLDMMPIPLHQLLARIPALPCRLPFNDHIMGFSTWENSDPDCPLKSTQEPDHPFALRFRHALRCAPSESGNFNSWGQCRNNGITPLVLGWAYVFSASLAERTSQQLRRVQLVGSKGSLPPMPEITIPLDFASPAECAWWRALLYPRTTFVWKCHEGLKFLPWSVIIDEGWNFDIEGPLLEEDFVLPSADVAAGYLRRFSDAFDLGTQCTAALAAVLTFPLHHLSGPRNSFIHLPPPSFPSPPNDTVGDGRPTEFQHLSYLMTLSMSLRTVEHVLQSAFWEPGLPCSLAGASLQGVSHTILPLYEDNNYELLAKILSHTEAGPLWLGSLICTRQVKISYMLERFSFASGFMRDATEFTGVVASFMHPKLGWYVVGGASSTVPRAKVWCLRQECSRAYHGEESLKYRSGPPHGWAPDGEMSVDAVELELRDHLQCRHDWTYTNWTWRHDQSTDVGYDASRQPSHWLLEADPYSTETSETNQNPASMSPEVRLSAQRLSKKAKAQMIHWCPEQLEEGSTAFLKEYGLIMNHDNGEAPPPSVPPKLDRRYLEEWLAEVSAEAKLGIPE